jgi:hypothetical protein
LSPFSGAKDTEGVLFFNNFSQYGHLNNQYFIFTWPRIPGVLFSVVLQGRGI